MTNKKVVNFSFRALRNDEIRGVFSEFSILAKTITVQEAIPFVESFGSAFKELEGFLEISFSDSYEAHAKEIHEERIDIYAHSRAVAKACSHHLDETLVETWTKLWKIYEASPVSLRINQAQATGAVDKLVESARKLGEESLNAVGFKIWIDKLEDVNKRFKETDVARFTERSNREVMVCQKLREKCYEAFDLLAKSAGLHATLGDEACIAFVDSVNATLLAKRGQVEVRRERSKASDAKAVSKESAQETSATTVVQSKAV